MTDPVVSESVRRVPAPTLEADVSFRDMLAMVGRHRGKVALLTCLATLAGGAFFFLRSPAYTAESFLQVIVPVSEEGKIDKDQFEVVINSHFQRLQSTVFAKGVVSVLHDKGILLDPVTVLDKMEISRPPKSDLVRVAGTARSGNVALLMVRAWTDEYLATVRKSRLQVALNQTRQLLRATQVRMLEHHGSVAQLKHRLEEMKPLVTLSKSIDNQALFGVLAEVPSNVAQVAQVRIEDQEQSEQWASLLGTLASAEQRYGAEESKYQFYRAVLTILEREGASAATRGVEKPGASVQEEPEQRFVESLLNSIDIVVFGEPALIEAGMGPVTKTAVVCIGVFVLASLGAVMVEWWRMTGTGAGAACP